MTGLIQRLFEGWRQVDSRRQQSESDASRSRRPRIESLESRDLLSISPIEYEAIREAYPALSLSEDSTAYRLVEITAAELSEAKLRAAIEEAMTTGENELIVCRTTETQHSITLSGAEFCINTPAGETGSINIVRLGEKPLTIDADGKWRHFFVDNGSDVGLAGITFVGGKTSNDQGGAILTVRSTLRLIDTEFRGNASGEADWWYSGGAIRAEGEGGSLWIENSTFQGNTSRFSGGAVSSVDVDVIVRDSVFLDNACASYGGGLYVNGGTAYLENTKFLGNSNDGNGGGVWIEKCSAYLYNVEFDGNRAKWGGGLQVDHAEMTARNLVFHDNRALYDGGGLNVTSSQVTMSDLSFWSNECGLFGGAMFFEAAVGTFVNITAGFNISDTDGGGLYTRGESDLTLVNVTLAHNTAKWGGGLYVMTESTVSLYNTIVAANTNKNVPSDVYQYLTTKTLAGSHNIIGMAENLKGLTDGADSNRIGTQDHPIDVLLGPMTDFGNGMPVMPLLSSSPAIDAGRSGEDVPECDAAGQPRYDAHGTANHVDIGSYEYQGKSAPAGTIVAEFLQPSTPKGIAVDSKNRVIVAEYLQNRIVVYTAGGTELFSFGRWGEGDGQLCHPSDVAVDKDDNIYVVSANDTVQVFDAAGRFVRSFGAYGTAPGELDDPRGIAYDALTDRIYVADTGNHRVQCFTTTGQVVAAFGSGGVIGTTGTLRRDHSGFDRPSAVAVHPVTGNVYVADRVNCRIEVYDANGHYVKTHHAVYRPEALTFLDDGDLLIAGDDTMKGDGYVNKAFEGRIRVLRNGSELVTLNYYGGIDDIGKRTSGVAALADGTIVFSDECNGRLATTRTVSTGHAFPEDIAFVEPVTDLSLDTYGTDVIVRWKTAAPSPSHLRWGADKANPSGEVSDLRLKTEHELTITGLTPQSLLYYQIGFGDTFLPDTILWTAPDKINSGVPAGEKLVLRLKAVGLIYTDKNDLSDEITQASEEEIRRIEELYRNTALFIWQNTGFNVWIDFVAMPRYTGDFIRENGTSTEEILSGMGFSREDDIDLVLSTSTCWDGAGGGYGGSGYMFGRGIGWSYQEWDDGRTIVHEVNHIFDFAVYGGSDLGKYENIHCIWSINDAVGGDRSCNAQAYRNLYNANYTATGGDYNKWIVVPDLDHDGLPDDSPTDQGLVTPLPITEKTLGTSPYKIDTDDDGVTDFDEARFFPFSGLDPTSDDTDGDGVKDGLDLNPGYPIGDHIAKGTPKLDGVIDPGENWTIVTDHWSYNNTFGIWDNNTGGKNSRTAMAWDDEYLYLGVEHEGWGWVQVIIDGGCGNWYLGPATYELGLHSWLSEPHFGTITSFQDMQMMFAAEYGDVFWDSDPRFTLPYQGRPIAENEGDGLGFEGPLIPWEDIRFVHHFDPDTQRYTWELAIPWSPYVTGLVGYDQKMLGLAVTIIDDKLFNTDTYAKIKLVDAPLPVERPTAIIVDAGSLFVQEGCVLSVSHDGIDPLGKGLTYLWDFTGTGDFLEHFGPTAWFSAEHLNGTVGAFQTIRLKVRDADGVESDVVEAEVSLLDVMPTYEIDGPTVGELFAGKFLRWNFTAYDVQDDAIVEWTVHWGDGGEETLYGGPRNRVFLNHLYREANDYVVTISTTDINGDVSTITFDVPVAAQLQINQPEPIENSAFPLSKIIADPDVEYVVTPVRFENEEFVATASFDFNAVLVDSIRHRQMLDLDRPRTGLKESERISFPDSLWGDDNLFETEWIDFTTERISREQDLIFAEEMLEDLITIG